MLTALEQGQFMALLAQLVCNSEAGSFEQLVKHLGVALVVVKHLLPARKM